MTKAFVRSYVLAFAMVLSGCISLLPETAPPKSRYHIEAADVASLTGAPLGWSLAIEDPHTTRVYDTVKIAVSTAPSKIEYFAGAEWADRAPHLFLTALVQTFEDSGRILAVGDRRAIPVGDIVLQTDIRKLQLDVQSGSPAAIVDVYARLTDGKGRVYAARRFNISTPVRSDKASDVIAGFDTGLDAVITGIVVWTYEEGALQASAS